MGNPYSVYSDTSISLNPEKLLEEHLPLIRYHASQLIRRVPKSIELDDLIDSGVLGLLEGASRFDDSKGIQFKTFISFRVRGAMIDYLRAFDWFPRSMRDASKGLQQALYALQQRYSRPAEEVEVAAYLGLDLKAYRDRLDQVKSISVVYFSDLPSIDNDDDSLDLIETIADNPEDVPERQMALVEFADNLAQAIAKLPMREKVLLSLYYHEELNMKEVALVLDLTESRVSQLHSQMVLRLRGLLNLEIPDA